MLVTLGYHAGDLAQAERLADWMRELGGLSGHRLLVARDKSTQARPFADVGFDSVEEIEITNDAWHGWPHSANNVFHAIHRQVEWTTKEPFLWLEPDCVPMPIRPGCFPTEIRNFLDAIWQEYQVALSKGKSFLGDFVSVHTAELDVPDHMSGVGIYPGVMTDHDPSGVICLAHEIAWDVSGAPVIMPQMLCSALIHHAWKHAPFQDQDALQREIYAFKPDCVLFHADKSGSLIEILRKGKEAAKPAEAGPILPVTAPVLPVVYLAGDFAGSNPAPCINLPVPVLAQTSRGDDQVRDSTTTAGVDEPDSRSGQFICDILIKSYPADYPLLEYCLKSLEKFATGFRQVIVIYPEGEPPNLWPAGDPLYKAVPIHENGAGDGYMFQQQVKANAHELTDARYICHFDSDCFITRPITPASFFQDGKPIWLMTPYAKIEAPWQASTEKFMGEPVEFEFMRRHPTFCPRSIHVAAAAFCLMKHGVTLKDYIMAQPVRDVSEFNLLGALAYSRAREDFTWIDTHTE